MHGQFNPHTLKSTRTHWSIQPAQVVNSTRTGFFSIFHGLYLKNEQTYCYEIFSENTSEDFQHAWKVWLGWLKRLGRHLSCANWSGEAALSIQPAQVVNSTRTGFFSIFRGPYFLNG